MSALTTDGAVAVELSPAMRRALNSALEREARRVARLLHDGAGQYLFALQLALTELDRRLPPHLAPVLDEIRGLTVQLDDQLRVHARELYPVVLENLGLVPALRQLFDTVERRSDLIIGFTTAMEGRQPADVEFSLYRGVQEALTNIIKHARATRITVDLRQAGERIRCSISDNGVGGVAIQPARNGRLGLGLVSIRERMTLVSGTVEIRSQPGKGTNVILSVPVRPGPRER